MNHLTKTVCVKQWQLFVMVAMTGFASGTILAKITTALGF
jgi:hypothetical protein